MKSGVAKARDLLKLLLAEHCVTLAQAGQDYWVYSEVYNERKGGYFVDVGAHDGIELSNTYLLEKRYGWSGICIEPNPISYKRLKRFRPSSICDNSILSATMDEEVLYSINGLFSGIVNAGSAEISHGGTAAGTVVLKAATLSHVLKSHKAPSVIDYLSIDCEGSEDSVLGDFPFSEYIFNCMTIERPSPDLRNWLLSWGYILIKEIPGLDCFYVHESFVSQYKKNMFAYSSKKHWRCRLR